MYKNSTFGQILKLLNRETVKKATELYKSDKHNKGFNTWSQLVTMLFAQFSNCKSLRDLEIRFNTNSHYHYHLNSSAVKKSTLSDANRNRNSEVFREIAKSMINGQNKEINSLISIIDSSMIRVDGRGSDWSNLTKTRCGKGLKLHIQSNENGMLEDGELTATNVNDISMAKEMELEKGRIYVFDKGYTSYDWWHKIASHKAYFVTRIKRNASYKVLEELDTKGSKDNVIRDCIISLSNKHPRGGKRNALAGKKLRLVEIYDNENDKLYQFITNLFAAKAEEIAYYYKRRWEVELLFKWLKQNLKVTKFLGESENAIRIQIYVALIAYVLLGMFKKLTAGTFRRTIDLLYWIRGAISSYNMQLRPPIIRHKDSNNKQLYFYGVL